MKDKRVVVFTSSDKEIAEKMALALKGEWIPSEVVERREAGPGIQILDPPDDRGQYAVTINPSTLQRVGTQVIIGFVRGFRSWYRQ